MHRIDAPGNLNSTFQEGDPGTGTQATQVGADWLNAVQEEVAHVIEAAGLELDKLDNTQLALAIGAMIAAAQPTVPGSGGRVGLDYMVTGDAAITIRAGALDISGGIYRLSGNANLALEGLQADAWYFLFAQAPAAGDLLTLAELSYSNTPPQLNGAKLGWYDAGGTKRCIGCLATDDQGDLVRAARIGQTLYYRETILENESPPLDTDTQVENWITLTLNLPALGIPLAVLIEGRARGTWENVILDLRSMDGEICRQRVWTLLSSHSNFRKAASGLYELMADESGRIQYWYYGNYDGVAWNNAAYLYMAGLRLPAGM